MAQTTAAATPQTGRAAGSLRWWALLVIAAAQLMIVLDATIVSVALPSIQSGLGISAAERQWVLTAYTLAFGGLLLLGGRIADSAGHKRLFVIGLVGFAAASALGGAAANLGMLLVGRVLQGAFAALLAPTALSLLNATFRDPRERGTAFGVFGAIVGGGGGVGLTLGGVLTQYLSWHWVFYVTVPIAATGALGAVLVLTDTGDRRRRRFDIPGVVTATAGLVALVYGFSAAVTRGWDAPLTVGLVASGVVLLAVFVRVESRLSQPMLPLRIVGHRGRGGAFVTVLLAAVGMSGAFFFVPLYLQPILGYTALQNGLALLPMTGAVVLSSTFAGKLMTRVPPRAMMSSGMFVAAGGIAWLTQIGTHTGYPAHILPSMIVIGLGLGLVFTTAGNVITFELAPHESGVASAIMNAGQNIGRSLGTALLNAIAAGSTVDYLTTHRAAGARATGLVHGYTVAFTWGAVIIALGGVIALVLTKARTD